MFGKLLMWLSQMVVINACDIKFLRSAFRLNAAVVSLSVFCRLVPVGIWMTLRVKCIFCGKYKTSVLIATCHSLCPYCIWILNDVCAAAATVIIIIFVWFINFDGEPKEPREILCHSEKYIIMADVSASACTNAVDSVCNSLRKLYRLRRKRGTCASIWCIMHTYVCLPITPSQRGINAHHINI